MPAAAVPHLARRRPLAVRVAAAALPQPLRAAATWLGEPSLPWQACPPCFPIPQLANLAQARRRRRRRARARLLPRRKKTWMPCWLSWMDPSRQPRRRPRQRRQQQQRQQRRAARRTRKRRRARAGRRRRRRRCAVLCQRCVAAALRCAWRGAVVCCTALCCGAASSVVQHCRDSRKAG